MSNHHYLHKAGGTVYRLQTSKNATGWICFINESDPLLPLCTTEQEAIVAAVEHIEAAVVVAHPMTEAEAWLKTWAEAYHHNN